MHRLGEYNEFTKILIASFVYEFVRAVSLSEMEEAYVYIF